MRRHQVLIPISREHHEMLVLAQLLKKNAPPYRGLPTTLAGKLSYAAEEYERFIEKHLKNDALTLYPYLQRFDEFEAVVRELKQMNEVLNLVFQHVKEQSVEGADQLGLKLEKYVRMKERRLFEEMQKHLSEHDFASLSDKLSDNF